ncbi:MAG: tryptophan--tRNA ligase [Candidatus Bathyarchaeota archaeon]|nr:tryptophan--tRNA ligase [Candidatus Bathyarchaeota archaeon]MDH5712986.1 tryptophan--tRNA ligase [Candidatus Bathyarchaeota archaeon]
MAEEEEEMIVTPWEVSGRIDYNKLIQKFGTQPLTEELLERLRKHTGKLHPQLQRKLFFSHRDLDRILDQYEAGQKFVLYTGRGPSGPVHLGHVVPWIFTKHLQDVFDAKLYFQMTDDEKFLLHPEFTVEKSLSLMYDNSLDVIAMGFDPKKTIIISDFKNINVLYDIAIRVAKHVTFSTVKAVFGFEGSSNIGIIFFPALQAAPCFVESDLTGKNVPCLIPAAIDQDPYWRVTRDIAPKLGYYKPAQIHCRFLPGLGKGGKMSASLPETCIFTTDPPEVAEKKIWNAFTGGKPTEREQKEYGGDPFVCTIYYYFYYLFEESDQKIAELERECKSGEIICGDCKKILAEKVKKFLREHQKKREKARDIADEFFVK